MARQRRHKSKPRRSRGRFARVYQLLSAVLIVAAVIAGCIVFFKVQTIEVAGNHRYTAEEIIAVSGIQVEDNLYTMNKFDIRAQVLRELPYIQDMTIRRRLPDTIVITVEESPAVAAVSDGERWWLMNWEGKLLEPTEDAGGVMEVRGLVPLVPNAGGILAVDESQKLQYQALLKIIAQLEAHGLLARINWMDLSSETLVTMEMDGGRFRVEVPLVCDFGQKFRVWAGALASDRLAPEDTGLWDLTLSDSVNLVPW
ncbi:MAG: FtsQ-type POTRA domain-containing protein [Oscillospiraceae bacterium]|nr:FtsQ-type POTRA domain-containing protein [Oscillospiraceae bacterium]